LGIIIGLEFFSIARKINPEFRRFSADAVSLGNCFCGGFSIYFSTQRDFPSAAVLVIFAALFDFADGYVARTISQQPSRRGEVIDDLGDFISFGLAPGALLFFVDPER